MYYHDIAFSTQLRFCLISFIAGSVSGLCALFLCAKPLKGALRFVCDVVFCLLSVFILVCTNIVFQEGALRVYQVAAFLAGLLLIVVLLKKHSDRVAEYLAEIGMRYLVLPCKGLYKHIVNNIKNLLKKGLNIVYNSINKMKEYQKRHAKDKALKKEKKKEPAGKTAS